MEIKKIGEILETVYPTAYWSFPENEAPPLPYLIYFEDSSDNFPADNIVYHPIKRIFVELYTKKRDPSAEKKVEDAFLAAELFWQKTLAHLDDEDAFEVVYTLEVI